MPTIPLMQSILIALTQGIVSSSDTPTNAKWQTHGPCIVPLEDSLRASRITSEQKTMSLVSGPGRGGVPGSELPDQLVLHVAKHVSYIQSLDTARPSHLRYHTSTHVLTAQRRV